MSRRIRARTLSHVLAYYIDRHTEEALRETSDFTPADGGEMLALLPQKTSWQLAEHMEPKVLARWIAAADPPALRKFLDNVGGQRLAPIWQVSDESLRTRIAELVAPAVQNQLRAQAEPGEVSG